LEMVYADGGCVIRGNTSRLAFAAAQAGGAAWSSPTHGLRYVHDGIGTIKPAVSEGLAQPFPALMVAPLDDVKEGTGRVGIGPVGA